MVLYTGTLCSVAIWLLCVEKTMRYIWMHCDITLWFIQTYQNSELGSIRYISMQTSTQKEKISNSKPIIPEFIIKENGYTINISIYIYVLSMIFVHLCWAQHIFICRGLKVWDEKLGGWKRRIHSEKSFRILSLSCAESLLIDQ